MDKEERNLLELIDDTDDVEELKDIAKNIQVVLNRVEQAIEDVVNLKIYEERHVETVDILTVYLTDYEAFAKRMKRRALKKARQNIENETTAEAAG